MIKHLVRANMAQSVEHHLGKVEVTGSIPVISSKMIAFAIFFYCYFITKVFSKFGRFCVFSKYQEITLCYPTWVFSLSSPMREFCKKYSGKLQNVNYYITHFMNVKFEKIVFEMDRLLQISHKNFKSFRCHYGNLKEIK